MRLPFRNPIGNALSNRIAANFGCDRGLILSQFPEPPPLVVPEVRFP
jgi:hypothetical protein